MATKSSRSTGWRALTAWASRFGWAASAHGPGHGAPADLRSRWHSGAPRRATPPAQGLHPHQQHEPDSGRRERRAPRGAAGRLGSGLRRDDNNIMSAAADLLTAAELHARLQSVGDQFYHHRHPFHLRMHEGELTRGQLQAWALNRYYYQSRIPIKDSIILSRSDDPEFRRAWRKRVVDHDGNRAGEGGIERWL